MRPYSSTTFGRRTPVVLPAVSTPIAQPIPPCYNFPYMLKAGAAGDRLRRPSSADRPAASICAN